MQLITTKEIVDIIKYNEHSAIIVEKIPLANSTQFKVQYSVIDFKEKSIDAVTKGAYLLRKFGANYEKISESMPNFVQCDAAVLYDRRILAVFPNGEAGIFDREGTLEWNGRFDYHDSPIKCLALEDKYFWSVCSNENCVIRYSSQNMKLDLRIGGKDSQTFISPSHISIYDGDLYVCCNGNKVRKIDGLNYAVSDYLNFNDSIKRFYKIGKWAIAVMHSGTYVMD
ncbi:MAG: hypothetical protein NC213_06500 [Acetobacter sp.]|nr:hypothetical protein [Bacteroides sp.]MCM1341375.1 hypothetical protein [Acetobacter sp.]MCM1433468.1 hypothetical protein [Clostridiales bacterium]